jgi:hypothetical protein
VTVAAVSAASRFDICSIARCISSWSAGRASATTWLGPAPAENCALGNIAVSIGTAAVVLADSSV